MDKHFGDFPSGPVVKNPCCNAGDTGLIPGPGTAHMPWSNKAHTPQLLSQCSRASEPQLLGPCAATPEACHVEPMLHNKRRHHDEKPVHQNEEQPAPTATRESLRAASKTHHSQKIK